jgi:hypothetical protein
MWHVGKICEMHIYTNFIRKPDKKRPLGRPRATKETGVCMCQALEG